MSRSRCCRRFRCRIRNDSHITVGTSPSSRTATEASFRRTIRALAVVTTLAILNFAKRTFVIRKALALIKWSTGQVTTGRSSLRATRIVSASRNRCASSRCCRVDRASCCCRHFFGSSSCCCLRFSTCRDVRNNDHPVCSKWIVLFLTRPAGKWALVGLNIPVSTLIKMKLAVRHQILASSCRYKKSVSCMLKNDNDNTCDDE